MIRSVNCAVFLLVGASAVAIGARTSWAVNLLPDPSFEDPVEIPDGSSPWDWVFGFEPQPSVNQTSDPLSGSEHAELQFDTDQLFTAFGPTIRSTAYAGSGASAAITDFTGLSLTVGTNYKVTAFDMSSPDPELPPSVLVRTYLAYFSDMFGFLGYGGIEGDPFFSDTYAEGVTSNYVPVIYTVTVPDFGTPVTSVDFTFGLIAPSSESGQQFTGTATVLFDDVMLDLAVEVDADFNGDGIVDAADYTIWRDSLGTTDLPPFDLGDADGDGVVDTLDYDIWKEHYGDVIPAEPGSGASATSAPEPSSMLILLAGIIIALSNRKICSHRTVFD